MLQNIDDLTKGQDNQRQNQSLGYLYDIELYEGFAYRLLLRHRSLDLTDKQRPGPEIIKLFFMLNSTEHEIFPAHKCENANNCWHFNIYEKGKYHFRLT